MFSLTLVLIAGIQGSNLSLRPICVNPLLVISALPTLSLTATSLHMSLRYSLFKCCLLGVAAVEYMCSNG